MDERDVLATRFEENRTHPRAVAYRMLGTRSEAEEGTYVVGVPLPASVMSR